VRVQDEHTATFNSVTKHKMNIFRIPTHTARYKGIFYPDQLFKKL